MISDDGDIQYIRFSFEDALFTSHVYKRNYRFPLKQAKRQDHIQPGSLEDTLEAPNSIDPETKTSTAILDDEDEERLLQNQMVQTRYDLFAEDPTESNIDQPQSNVLDATLRPLH